MSIKANVFIDLVGLLITLVIVFSGGGRPSRAPENRIFRCMLGCITLILMCDIPAWILDGAEFAWARAALYALDTLYYLLQPIFCFLWIMYADWWNFESKERLKKLAPLYAVPMVIEIALIIINLWTGWIFVINGQNVYVRGEYYIINLIPYYLYIAGSLALTAWELVFSGDDARRHKNGLFLVIMVLPVAGTVMVTQTYGIACDWPLSAMALLMIHLDVQNRRLLEQQLVAAREAEKSATLQTELTKNRVSIMLSQIQPHFLYNALNTIKCLCDNKDDRAGAVVADFAKFLRGNMDSLNARAPIPLGQEIEHLKRYLAIEELRFPEVQVIFDIRRDDFSLPALTLQPLVENAIRYGFINRDSGRVTVSAWADERHYYASVADDGVGFDPTATQYDGRSHIGINNTRERIRTMCGGELNIKSVPGEGTTVTIVLPRNTHGKAGRSGNARDMR